MEKQMIKRVVFTQGGKGGVGKTTVANNLADWYKDNGISVKLLDFDCENKAASGFCHFHDGATKYDINKEGSLDEIFSILDNPEVDVMLIDQAAASGATTFKWFSEVGEAAKDMGIGFTAIGVVTGDPGSVESVIDWIGTLGDTAEYLIILNQLGNDAEDFKSYHTSKTMKALKKEFNIQEIVLQHRMAELEEMMRLSGDTLGQVAGGLKGALGATRWKIRANGYKNKVNSELDKVSDLLLVTASAK